LRRALSRAANLARFWREHGRDKGARRDMPKISHCDAGPSPMQYAQPGFASPLLPSR
jgi:hypothetical protein